MSTLLSIATVAGAALLSLALVAALVSMRSAASPLGRIVALDVMLSTVLIGIAGVAALRGDGTYVDLLLAASLVGFAATAAMARFVERRGDEDA